MGCIGGVRLMGTHQYNFNKNDEYQTPENAVYPLLNYIKPNSTIWCPFDKDKSNYVQIFKQKGFNVINSHIESGGDFFEMNIPDCDYIISNPPYSKRTEVFDKLFDIGKPFAMLMNFQGIFDSKKRFGYFSKHSNSIGFLVLYPRVKFLKQNNETKNTPFQSGYICYKILDNGFEFEYIGD